MNFWAVIPSCCRRTELAQLVARLRDDDVNVVIIDTGYANSLSNDSEITAYVLDDRESPKNISRWWNRGLRFVENCEDSRDYVVAVLNDDVVVPPGFVQQLAHAFAIYPTAAAACPNVYGLPMTQLVQSTHGGPRMPGYAFALNGRKRILADETMQWWYGDNDIDWQARALGGVVHLRDATVQHLYPDSTTVGALAEQAGRDRQTFVGKWGRAPW